MAAFARAKRVTALLDEKVRARLRGDGDTLAGYESSGSEHEATSSLSGFLLDGFFDCDTLVSASYDDGEGRDREPSSSSLATTIPSSAMIRDLMNPAADRFRSNLLTDVTEAVERLGSLRTDRSVYRRAVMNSLRGSGYNAGICKSRWGGGGGITAGSYEYVDVVRSAAGEALRRYVVDLDFAAEFEIARPTAEYGRMLAELPRVFVGRVEELKAALRILAAAVKRSLRSSEMHVPPWRKASYMQAKWLGPYKRSTNAAPSCVPSAGTQPAFSVAAGFEVPCRAVGFQPSRLAMAAPPTR